MKKNNEVFNLIKEQMEVIISSLDKIEGKVIKLKYGLDDGYPKTNEQVGQILNLSVNDIIKIENNALRKMRETPEN